MDRNVWTAGKLANALRALIALALIALVVLATSAAGDESPAPSGATLSAEVEAEEQHEEQALAAAPTSRAAAKAPGPVIGIDDATGWGAATADSLLAAHVFWNRVEIGASPPDTVAESLRYGFKVLAIAGNVGDGKPLSGVEPSRWGAQVASQLKANPGASLVEAGNEMYLKGGVANPVQYGKLYMAGVEALGKAGIATPFLFDMTGDYQKPSGAFSEDAHGGGWLRDAVSGVPGLAAAIRANGLAVHPYGAVDRDVHDSYGTASVAAEEAVAKAVLGVTPPVYVTEFGYDLSRCGSEMGACGERQQANRLRQAYRAFMADPNVQGIWWYQARDDGTGRFGVLGPSGARPAFKSLARMAKRAGW
jgi:hypothetical protein